MAKSSNSSMMDHLHLLPRSLAYIALASFVVLIARMIQVRLLFRRAAKQYGIPMMPHSMILGHLAAVGKMVTRLKVPSDLAGQIHIGLLAEEYPELAKHGLLYMDMWPLAYPMIAVFDPDLLAQFIQDNSLPKFHAQGHVEFKPFTNAQDLVHLEGQEWKTARAIFNPGFSTRNLMSLIPSFVEETLVFREKLMNAAKNGKTIELEDLTTTLTVDVVSRAVLGVRIRAQEGKSPLMEYMKKQIALLYLQLELRKQLNPLIPLKHWWYNRKVAQHLAPIIQDTVDNYEKITGPKTILALAFKSYVEEVQDKSQRGFIPPEFQERVINHIKMFMFAGHDTTATTLAYSLYLLSTHPEVAAKLRAEHDEVLGPVAAEAGERISLDPSLLNKLPYTLAVMKETLRLYAPVGGSIREAPEGMFLDNPKTGLRYPLHGFMLHSNVVRVMRDPQHWPEPERFLPERWMVRDESDAYYPRKNTWRPFEMGPRNCIGQELVALEVKLVLAMTVREFDFAADYPNGAPTFQGSPAYQVYTSEQAVTAHVKDHLPVKITAR